MKVEGAMKYLTDESSSEKEVGDKKTVIILFPAQREHDVPHNQGEFSQTFNCLTTCTVHRDHAEVYHQDCTGPLQLGGPHPRGHLGHLRPRCKLPVQVSFVR